MRKYNPADIEEHLKNLARKLNHLPSEAEINEEKKAKDKIKEDFPCYETIRRALAANPEMTKRIEVELGFDDGQVCFQF